jgi:hypothetical protein
MMDGAMPANLATKPAQRQRRMRFLPPGRAATLLSMSAGLLLFVAANANAQNPDDPTDILLHARQNVLDTIQRLPRYICTETINRARYEPGNRGAEAGGSRDPQSCDDTIAETGRESWKQSISSSDRLRLDVAVNLDPSAGDGEMYSWVGADRFSSRDVFDIVSEGALSTGTFSSMLRSIFGGRVARFSYHGDSIVGGHSLSEFGFHVPQEQSSYLYLFGKGRSRQARVGYGGTVLVDPETHDLVRLEVRTSALPPESGVCELTRTVTYGRVRLNGSDFLLPTEARISVVHADYARAENVITYSGCREFQGESTVLFGRSQKSEIAEPPVASPPRKLRLPAGLPFKVVFTEPIDPASAAAGDTVQAKLETPIHDRSEVLVAAGASITGRIVNLRRWYPGQNGRQQPSSVIEIKLESIDLGGVTRPFTAAADTGRRRFAKAGGSLSRRVDIGTLDQLPRSGVARFEFRDAAPGRVVGPGLESTWVTAAK